MNKVNGDVKHGLLLFHHKIQEAQSLLIAFIYFNYPICCLFGFSQLYS